MTKSVLNSLSPMGASEYIQFVSCIQVLRVLRKPGSRNVTNEVRPMRKEEKLTARLHMETSGREGQKLCFAS
jgi:hypothetical protein